MDQEQSTASPQDRPADAVPLSFVDRAPGFVQPYLRLARLDRPIGWQLLFLPSAASLALASPFASSWLEILNLALLFLAGAIAMRGAGCTYNDIIDRNIDAKVERTRGRPIPSGAVSVRAAFIFLAAQCLIGLLVLVQLNLFAIVLGLASLLLVGAYPFMKRITDWPQAWLGLTFNWGALMGWAAVTGSLGAAPILLYLGCAFWTLGYDTIYALQDKEDDALIGVRSTARLFGHRSAHFVFLFYAAAILFWFAAGFVAGSGLVFALLLMLPAMHLVSQVLRIDIDDGAGALRLFKSNRDTGLLLTLTLLGGSISGV
ncbi:MAG: 4-hydroxybenzoate octaprenyltransferase [Alphaproteobacteria bacterium]|nr:4-hydroxybenzoate octaprenyltransferase [Alphaproteobacteria bacterium]